MDTDLTKLLNAAAQGDKVAEDKLFRIVSDRLQRLAGKEMGNWKPGQTLEPNALVHEAYVRLFGSKPKEWPDRRYFFRAAAISMHEIMIEYHRRKYKKVGKEPLPEEGPVAPQKSTEIDPLDLKLALEEIEEHRSRAVDAFRYRYILGFSYEKIADLLGVGHATAERDVRDVRDWIKRKFSPNG